MIVGLPRGTDRKASVSIITVSGSVSEGPGPSMSRSERSSSLQTITLSAPFPAFTAVPASPPSTKIVSSPSPVMYADTRFVRATRTRSGPSEKSLWSVTLSGMPVGIVYRGAAKAAGEGRSPQDNCGARVSAEPDLGPSSSCATTFPAGLASDGAGLECSFSSEATRFRSILPVALVPPSRWNCRIARRVCPPTRPSAVPASYPRSFRRRWT